MYRILPVFKASLMPALGILATHRVAKQFERDMTPEHWRGLFRNEMEWQVSAMLRSGASGEQQVNATAERWFTERAASEVIGAALEHKAEIFAELAISEGMPIDPQSPYQLAQDYLQARMENDRQTMERIVREAAGRSMDVKVKTDDFLSLDPLERLEMMLANMALRGPSGGTPRQDAPSFTS